VALLGNKIDKKDMNRNTKTSIVCCLIGILTSLAGYPVYNFATKVFSIVNLLIVIFAMATATLMMSKEEKN
jgi:uncharacterized membrane protein